MRGNVIGFDPDTNSGAINGFDGRRYDFTTADWHGHNRPRHGDAVDFIPEDQRAAQIYLIEPEYQPPSFAGFYFSPAGRISRSQYWLRFFLPVFVVSVVLHGLALADGALFKVLSNAFQLLVLWPGIAVLIKRIHDRNKSGWLAWWLYGPLILAIPFVIAGAIAVATQSATAAGVFFTVAGMIGLAVVVVAIWFFVEFGCLRGTIGANHYGPDPVRED